MNGAAKTDPTLRVAGNIVSGNPLNINNGSAQVGGTVLGDQNGPRKLNFNGGGSLINGVPSDASEIISNLTGASLSLWNDMTDNSAYEVSLNQPGPFKFNPVPDASGTAVFTVDGDVLFNNSRVQQIQLTSSDATAIVINVSGKSINWTNGNFVGLFNTEEWQSKVIWNVSVKRGALG